MQLKKISALALGTSTLITPLILNAASSDEVKFTQMRYEENNDRMKIDFSVLDFKKDFGTDYTLNMSVSYDAMSGGTPVWDSVSSASTTSSGKSNDARCVANPTLCSDVSSVDGLLSSGEANMNNFTYKNVQVDDTRIAVSSSLVKRTQRRDEMTFGLAYSKEEDFKSHEASFGYLYNLDSSRNDSIAAGLSFQYNKALDRMENKWDDFNVLNFQIGYTKVFTPKLQGQINYFASRQKGELSNPYQRIIRYFNISTSSFDPVFNYFIAKEKRPEERVSNGISLDSAYKAHQKVSLHGAYRLYIDDWGVNSHTFSANAYIEVLPKLTVIPLIRYYTQTKADFYRAHNEEYFHFAKDSLGSSDERLSSYHGTTYSLGLEYKIQDNFTINAIASTQKQSYGLKMDWYSVGLKYSF